MNGTAQQLRAAILDQPEDPARWGIYADWLEEHGHAAAAGVREFIDLESREVARWINLVASANASGDPEHASFCEATAATGEALREAVDAIIRSDCYDLFESEAFSGVSAETNASGWDLDDVEVQSLGWTKGACVVTFSYTATGQQDPDRPYAGGVIDGAATARIDAEERVVYSAVTAGVRDYGPDEPDDGPAAL